MKKLVLIVAAFFAICSVVYAGDDIPVTLNQLPANAQKFIKTHFASSEISYAKLERDWLEKKYDVIFTSGDKLEFDARGNWTDIDCKFSEVPGSVIPPAIKSYVEEKHPQNKIVQLERDKKVYEVELNNGIELKFNHQFKILKVEY